MALSRKQRSLYHILNDFDEFCSKNDLQYVLAAGTLLGCVRHNGIIPWDNDVDILISDITESQFVSAVQNSNEFDILGHACKNYIPNTDVIYNDENRHLYKVFRKGAIDKTLPITCGHDPKYTIIDVFVCNASHDCYTGWYQPGHSKFRLKNNPFESIQRMRFYNKKLPCSAHFDEYLKNIYGSRYMTHDYAGREIRNFNPAKIEELD